MQSKFRCIVPHAAAGAPARPSLYGHGLLGSRNEVTQGQLQDMANEHDFVFCATEWIGMSCPDIPTSPHDFQKIFTDALEGRTPNTLDCDIPSVATILTDVSSFPALADRVQQGMLNFLYLGRAMIHPDGFAADPAFQLDGHSVLDTTRLFYDGNSQGGIIGGALAAVAPDYDRAALGVLGMNYSTLLQRSVDFGTGQAPHPDPSDPESVVPEYAYPLYQSYPKEIERQLVISMMQLLWDRAEANGYAHHMTTDPLPNTPPHQVLLQGALGDHQVAQITAETEARTIGAYTRTQYTDPGRDLDVEPAFGIPRFPVFPFAGSALILWDSGPPRVDSEGNARGTSPPPPANVPPNGAEEDPHELPRRSPAAREQKSAFLRVGGQVIEVCGDRPCYAGGWTGP